MTTFAELHQDEALAVLDLLRVQPDPYAEIWDWLAGLAQDAGLVRSDIAGCSVVDAVTRIHAAEQVWGFKSSVLHPFEPKLPHRTEGELRAALVRQLGLPKVALRLPLSSLEELATAYYCMDPETWRLRVREAFTLTVETVVGCVHLEVEAA